MDWRAQIPFTLRFRVNAFHTVLFMFFIPFGKIYYSAKAL